MWWRDETLVVGSLASATQRVIVENVLTAQRALLEVPVEETLEEVQERYKAFNQHAGSYTWKYVGRPLHMLKTLNENGIPNERVALEKLGINSDDWVPVIHVFFNDDLTEA